MPNTVSGHCQNAHYHNRCYGFTGRKKNICKCHCHGTFWDKRAKDSVVFVPR